MAEVSDEFAAQNVAEEAERVEASRSRSKIERSMQRYAENNRSTSICLKRLPPTKGSCVEISLLSSSHKLMLSYLARLSGSPITSNAALNA